MVEFAMSLLAAPTPSSPVTVPDPEMMWHTSAMLMVVGFGCGAGTSMPVREHAAGSPCSVRETLAVLLGFPPVQGVCALDARPSRRLGLPAPDTLKNRRARTR